VRASIRSSLVAGAIACPAFACHHAAPIAPVNTVQSGVNRDSIARANARRDSIERADAERRRQMARADSLRKAAEAASVKAAAARAALLESIHFDFDRTEILPADRPVLEQKVAILRANPPLQLRIDGNTDERGSDEYNLALGLRRAVAAKRYLVERGVADNRITTVSNGEERPICHDHDEVCWIQNRRAEFAVTAGGDNLVIPQ
jgi:peptidoglycan-associated lipoprotein